MGVRVHLQRITIQQIRNDEWFQRGYVPVSLLECEDVNLDDVNAAFGDAEVFLFLCACVFKLICIHFSSLPIQLTNI